MFVTNMLLADIYLADMFLDNMFCGGAFVAEDRGMHLQLNMDRLIYSYSVQAARRRAATPEWPSFSTVAEVRFTAFGNLPFTS
jgi:hypothetical protein